MKITIYTLIIYLIFFQQYNTKKNVFGHFIFEHMTSTQILSL